MPDRFQKERGVSLYIAFMIMSSLLAIALGMGTILFSQLSILRGIGHSVFAFYATDAGIERALYEDNAHCSGEADRRVCLEGLLPAGEVLLPNEAAYSMSVEAPDDLACGGTAYCVKSIGSFKDARRAVRIAR